MKQSLIILLFSLSLLASPKLFSQNLDVIGKVKIGTMDKVNSTDSILVLLTDGTLAFRDASSLEFVPYLGATQAVDLEAFDLKVNALTIGKGGGSIATNTASGDHALYSNTTSYFNTASGAYALTSSTGHSNTASGYKALYSKTTGSQNTANGRGALYFNTTGYDNLASGLRALFSSTTGNNNVASGVRALYSNTTGNYNTASGKDALYYNTAGSDNTASGKDALYSNTKGNRNTAIGYSADVSLDSLTNATAIGANAIVNASNKVRIGDAAVTVIEGQIAFSPTSDRRLKEEIVTVALGKDFVNDLNPVQYHRINNSNEDVEMGIIAQELLVVLKKHGLRKSGMVSQLKDSEQYMSVRYNDLLAPMIKALQELSQENDMMKSENEILKSEVKRIDESLGAIKAMLSSRSR
jgi:hypothetical protein